MFSKNSISDSFSDRELFSLIQKGNKEAFTIAYNRYNKQLYALSYRYLMDQSLAEDAVQHVFVKLWELHSHLEVSISIKNYLYTMTKNYVLNVIRNQKNVIAHNYAISQSGHINVYEDCLIEAIENKETIAHFYSAINKLPDQKKTVCLMKLEGRYSNQEIAEKMNISINTVKTHYAQSIKILKQHLEKILIFIYIILSS